MYIYNRGSIHWLITGLLSRPRDTAVRFSRSVRQVAGMVIEATFLI